MERKLRIAGRKNLTVNRLNETARAVDKAMAKAGIPSTDKEAFLNWTVERLWSTYKEERMNQRLIIENEIKSLGIRFPNGTVKKNMPHSFNSRRIKSPTWN